MDNIDIPKWLPQVILGGGVALILLSSNPFRFVDNGQNLVVFSWFGGVQEAALGPGFHVITPIISETIAFDIQTKALTWKDEDASGGAPPYGPRLISLSRDGQEIRSEVTLNFRVANAAKLYSTLGTDYVERVAPIVRSVIASETAGFAAQDLYSTKRPALQSQIRERIATDLQQYGIEVQEFLLRDVSFDKDFVSAIEAKTISENQLAKKQFEIDQAKQDALTVISQAQAEAGQLGAKADALTRNPDYLKVVKSGVLGDTLDTLVTK